MGVALNHPELRAVAVADTIHVSKDGAAIKACDRWTHLKEPPAHYAWFVLYRDLGLSRKLSELPVLLRATDDADFPDRLKRIATLWSWNARCNVWDSMAASAFTDRVKVLREHIVLKQHENLLSLTEINSQILSGTVKECDKTTAVLDVLVSTRQSDTLAQSIALHNTLFGRKDTIKAEVDHNLSSMLLAKPGVIDI